MATSEETTKILTFRVICAWCKIVLHAGDLEHPVSHGICEKCKRKMEAEIGGPKK